MSDTMPARNDYQDIEQSKQARLQMIWDENMVHVDKTSPHERTAVILISWDPELDDLKTGEEVERLHRVFQDKYNFKVYSTQINAQKKPQVQAHKYLAEFVYHEDGPRTLLIVYYAGHGFAGEKAGTLNLAGRRIPGKLVEGPNKAEIVWHNAEGIISDTEADVLVIFDCCHAGNLGRSYHPKRWPNRCSEYLGATSANSTTPIPGDSSFTSALIWALEGLYVEPSGFTTTELRRKIIEYPKFPKEQVPILCERDGSASLKHIVIAPITNGPTVADAHGSRGSEELQEVVDDYLDLRVFMDRTPSEDEVGSMSELFSHLIRKDALQARRVALLDTRHTRLVRAAASKWRFLTLRRGDLSSIAIPDIRTEALPSQGSSSLRSEVD